MRVLITTDVVGGVWAFTQELTAGLLKNGCSVALVSVGAEPQGWHWEWARGLQCYPGERFRFESCLAPLEWMPENARAYDEAAPLLMKLIREFKPDLLHSNQFCFGALPVELPKVITVHSDVLSWADACRSEPLERTDWLVRYCELVQEGLRGAASVVAPTRWMGQAFTRNFAVTCPLEVILNGRSHPHRCEGACRMQAITAGRLWDEAKDVRILNSVRSPFALRAAGDAGALACSDSGIDGIEYLGPLTGAELHKEFCESAIYICTSRYEPFGLAPLEAALCGCAVVARSIPSLQEVWQEGAMYFSDADSLSEVLRMLHGAPELLSQLRKRSFLRAREFTADRMVQSYFATFTKVLARPEACEHVA